MIIPSEWVEKADAFFMDAERHVNDGLYGYHASNRNKPLSYTLRA